MAGDLSQIPFRSAALSSFAEFDRYRVAMQPVLARRRAREAALAKTDGPFDFRAVCALCRRLVRMSVGARREPAGADAPPEPAWADELRCQCGLNNRERALAHAALTLGGADQGVDLLLIGPDTPVSGWLQRRSPEARRLDQAGPGESLSGYDLAVATEPAATAETMETAVRDAAAALRTGGRLLFTLRRPALEAGGGEGALGWEVMERVRSAGLAEVHAHHHWSEELGYLGRDGFVFVARKT